MILGLGLGLMTAINAGGPGAREFPFQVDRKAASK